MADGYTSPSPASEDAVPPDRAEPDGFRLSQILARCLHLLRHAQGAGDTQAQLVGEIESWGRTLDRLTRDTLQQLNAACDSLRDLAERVHALAEQTGAEMRRSLGATSAALDKRAGQFEGVLDEISRIGQTVRMLALNATIEAARSGEAGRGFAVVAQEVRALAQNTLATAENARTDISLGDVQGELAAFSARNADAMQALSQAVEKTNHGLIDTFDRARRDIDQLAEQNRVLWETLGGIQAAAERIRTKEGQVSALLGRTARLWQDDRPALALDLLLRSELIHADPGFDRLDEIRRRGRLRVAVEPDFKGLSFRGPGGRLQGLDIAYAEAFAAWLGVGVDFVEHPWDLCTELLHAGRKPGEAEVDLVWSALPPNERWAGVAYSEPYTYLRFVLARRKGDAKIGSLADLDGKVLGCINDPAAFATLEAAGLRWAANAGRPGGRAALANLVAYTDQSRIHDCLAEGSVDAFAVDRPIYHWACTSPDSPWAGRIEVLPIDLAPDPWYYAAGVADEPSSYRLLRAVNEFIAWHRQRPERAAVERQWQGEIVAGQATYRDEKGNLRGEEELAQDAGRRLT